jgi:hypothetical protein
MADPNVPLPLLPAHIQETIRSIARLHAEHHQNATPLQRAVDRGTALVGHPRVLGVLTFIVASWISLNLLAGALGYHPIDPQLRDARERRETKVPACSARWADCLP